MLHVTNTIWKSLIYNNKKTVFRAFSSEPNSDDIKVYSFVGHLSYFNSFSPKFIESKHMNFLRI